MYGYNILAVAFIYYTLKVIVNCSLYIPALQPVAWIPYLLSMPGSSPRSWVLAGTEIGPYWLSQCPQTGDMGLVAIATVIAAVAVAGCRCKRKPMWRHWYWRYPSHPGLGRYSVAERIIKPCNPKSNLEPFKIYIPVIFTLETSWYRSFIPSVEVIYSHLSNSGPFLKNS